MSRFLISHRVAFSDRPAAGDFSMISRVSAPVFFAIFWLAWVVGAIATRVGVAMLSMSELRLLLFGVVGVPLMFGLLRLRHLVSHVDSRSNWLQMVICLGTLWWAFLYGNFSPHRFPWRVAIIAVQLFLGLCLIGLIVVEQISLRLPQWARDLVQVWLLVVLLFFLSKVFVLYPALGIILVAVLSLFISKLLIAARVRWWGGRMALRPVAETVGLPSAKPKGVVIPVISDTHVSPVATEETNQNLERVLSRLRTMSDLGPLLFTGDLTNEGRLSEWLEWDRILKKHVAGRPVLIIPGNHDLLFGRGTTMARSARFLLAAYRLLPAKTQCYGVDGHKVALQKLLRPELRWLKEEAVAWTQTSDWPLGLDYSSIRPTRMTRFGFLRSLYPMWWDHPSDPLRIILLNSCNNIAATFLDNGVGRLGRPQLERLSRLVQTSSQKQLVIALHHQVAFPTDPSFVGQLGTAARFVQWGALSLLDADALYDALQVVPPDRMTIVHGHKHVAYAGRWKDAIRVFSAPSATKRVEARQEGFPMLFAIRIQRAREPDLVDFSACR